MTAKPDPLQSRAVLLGVSRYSYLEDLPGVADNLPALAEAVCGPFGWGLDAEHCSVVAEPASLEEMLEPVSMAAMSARDTLLVYYAGHGLLNRQQELHLGLRNSRVGRGRTAVPYAWLREAITEGRAQRHVIILDCCFSGRALGSMSGPGSLADQAWIDGSFLMAAAPETGPALDPPGERYTAFTGELLSTMEQGVPGAGMWLTMDDLYGHLRSVLTSKDRPTPQRRTRNRAGELVWGRNAGYERSFKRPAHLLATSSAWPDPDRFLDASEFIHALGVVRSISGLTQRELSSNSPTPLSEGSISRLLNRDDLPHRWTKTIEAYLSSCGIPDDHIERWKAAWERLRAASNHALSTVTPATTPEPDSSRSLRSRFKAIGLRKQSPTKRSSH
ncbi:caspase domain-containing protein [Streptomyces sp. NPDC005263]|uniref:caspase family protein n=1 Tax=Streptomyces sp. NPDC005263 TaxID=3364711 RepID=UPI0036B62B78